MAGFRTHITTSSVLGVGYAGAGIALGLPYPSSLLAGGLCSISGMLPDLDSDTGIPLRETMAFTAAVVPLMLIDRFQYMNLSTEEMVLAGALIYLVIRFGGHKFISRYTVHRGMFHSLPAALIVGLIVFLLCSGSHHELPVRYYKAGGAMLGYLSHLVLDEIYSVQIRRGRLRLKKSFGTALKFWGRSAWGNISTYAKLALLTWLVFQDPILREQIQPVATRLERLADQAAGKFFAGTDPSAYSPTIDHEAAPHEREGSDLFTRAESPDSSSTNENENKENKTARSPSLWWR